MSGSLSITGGQCRGTLIPANRAAQGSPVANATANGTSFKITYNAGYEDHKDLDDTRTRRQQVSQHVTVAINGRDVAGFKMALAKHQSRVFLNTGQTCKYHFRIDGKGSDGSMTHLVKWVTFDTADVDYTGQDKGGVEALTGQGEELDD